MLSTVRRKASAALVVVAAAGTLSAAAGPVSAASGKQTTVPAAAVKAAQKPDRWIYCSVAPAGSLVIDYQGKGTVPNHSTCWSGSGRTTNPDQAYFAYQVHTANNRGSLHLKTGTNEWDKPFDRNQTIDLPAGTLVLGLSLNE
ncbi:hypothetical protein [Streptomyces sp. 8N706]|uniref:hypothetical protein n=1 Tax=Streptomyces sp. 8N706 TaxID=3457416 RepID=UPI003FD03615